jgi:phi LC3 family holin
MSIDLKARLRNKAFWVAMASAIALLIQQLGFKNLIPSNYADIVNSILSILVMLGIIIDPSTTGIGDKVPIESNIEAQSSIDKSIDSTIPNAVQASNDNLASSKIQVADPNNVQVIGQEVSHISADKPQ